MVLWIKPRALDMLTKYSISWATSQVWDGSCLFLFSFNIWFIYLCAHICVHVYISWHMCGSQRVIFRNRVSPSTLYMPGFALKSLGLAACAFPCWASSPACCYLFLYMHLQECIRARYFVRYWTWISQKDRQEACSRVACILVAIKHKIK